MLMGFIVKNLNDIDIFLHLSEEFFIYPILKVNVEWIHLNGGGIFPENSYLSHK